MKIEERNEQIKNLYLAGNLSMEEIGERFNLVRIQIHRILLKQGITGTKARAKKFDRWIAKVTTLIERDPMITNYQLARKLNVSYSTITKILRKADLMRDMSAMLIHYRTIALRRRAGLSEDLLFKLYLKEKKSLREIAEQFRCHPTTIRNYLKRFGIKLRPRGPNTRK